MDGDIAEPTWGNTADTIGSWYFEAGPNHPSPSGSALGAPRSPARWLTDTLRRLLGVLHADSRLQRAEVATASLGEDAYRADFSRAGSVDGLLRYLLSCDDFTELSLAIAPLCMDVNGHTFELPFGLELRIEAPVDDRFQPLHGLEHPFSFALFANTTIYTEATWDGRGDNRAWARANQPALRGLLERFETTGGLQLSRCESSFTDQIRRWGFCNLHNEFRVYHVNNGPQLTHVVERLADGLEVVIASRFELVNTTLFIEYELAAPGTETAARIMLLEHLVPQLLTGRGFEATTAIHFKNRQSHHELPIAWPTRPSPRPNFRIR